MIDNVDDKESVTLNRFTNIFSLLNILRNQELTLLSPDTWDDRNDSLFLEKYKNKKGLRTVCAMCFTNAGETYHHWKCFSDGSGGICIRFNRDKMLERFDSEEGVRHGYVEYKKLKDVFGVIPDIDELPFLKRFPYRAEREYRVIYESKSKEAIKNISIRLDYIERIMINPWISEALVESLKETIRSIDGCEKIKIYRTTLNENTNWLNFGDRAE